MLAGLISLFAALIYLKRSVRPQKPAGNMVGKSWEFNGNIMGKRWDDKQNICMIYCHQQKQKGVIVCQKKECLPTPNGSTERR